MQALARSLPRDFTKKTTQKIMNLYEISILNQKKKSTFFERKNKETPKHSEYIYVSWSGSEKITGIF